MNKPALVLLALFSTSSLHAENADEALTQEAMTTGKAAASALISTLMPALTDALAEGSPAEAIHICASVAIEYTEQAGTELEPVTDLRRVTTRYRNPLNAPDEKDEEILASFPRTLPESGPEPVVTFRTLEDGREEAVYYQPLYVKPLCLPCHGTDEQRPDDVKQILTRLYPNDLATGYSVNDFRGAIRVGMDADTLADRE